MQLKDKNKTILVDKFKFIKNSIPSISLEKTKWFFFFKPVTRGKRKKKKPKNS